MSSVFISLCSNFMVYLFHTYHSWHCGQSATLNHQKMSRCYCHRGTSYRQSIVSFVSANVMRWVCIQAPSEISVSWLYEFIKTFGMKGLIWLDTLISNSRAAYTHILKPPFSYAVQEKNGKNHVFLWFSPKSLIFTKFWRHH